MSHRNRKKRSTAVRPVRMNPPAAGSFVPSDAAISQPAAISRSGADGYANAAAFLGEMSALLSAGTFLRRNLTANTELLTAAYRESWLAKRIIDMPSEDMTRKWYKLTTSLDTEVLRSLQRMEGKHSVQQELTNAIRWARLYGGAIAVMVVRDFADSLEEPLVLDDIPPHSFHGLLVLDRAQGITPSMELVKDLNDPDYGEPAYYEVDTDMGEQKHVRIHHSRVLKFVGRELPRLEMQAENYWGASELEHIGDELQKRNATSANIAQLMFQANVTTLKMGNFGEALMNGTDRQKQSVLNAMQEENRLRTSYGLQILSSDDQMENLSYSFTGVSDVYETFMMDMAGASEIPATKLFGRSPQGFNANGISDLKNYAEYISGLQERMLRPALEKLLPVMATSCWGYCPDDLDIVFESIIEPTPAERADLVDKLSASVISAFQAGMISRREAIEELKARGAALGVWAKLDESSPLEGTKMNAVMKNGRD